MGLTATATNGAMLPLESLAQTYTYDGSGNLLTTVVIYADIPGTAEIAYTQTRTYNGSNQVLTISNWVAAASPPVYQEFDLLNTDQFVLLNSTNFLLLATA